jgi:hypothetical protein
MTDPSYFGGTLPIFQYGATTEHMPGLKLPTYAAGTWARHCAYCESVSCPKFASAHPGWETLGFKFGVGRPLNKALETNLLDIHNRNLDTVLALFSLVQIMGLWGSGGVPQWPIVAPPEGTSWTGGVVTWCSFTGLTLADVGDHWMDFIYSDDPLNFSESGGGGSHTLATMGSLFLKNIRCRSTQWIFTHLDIMPETSTIRVHTWGPTAGARITPLDESAAITGSLIFHDGPGDGGCRDRMPGLRDVVPLWCSETDWAMGEAPEAKIYKVVAYGRAAYDSATFTIKKNVGGAWVDWDIKSLFYTRRRYPNPGFEVVLDLRGMAPEELSGVEGVAIHYWVEDALNATAHNAGMGTCQHDLYDPSQSVGKVCAGGRWRYCNKRGGLVFAGDILLAAAGQAAYQAVIDAAGSVEDALTAKAAALADTANIAAAAAAQAAGETAAAAYVAGECLNHDCPFRAPRTVDNPILWLQSWLYQFPWLRDYQMAYVGGVKTETPIMRRTGAHSPLSLCHAGALETTGYIWSRHERFHGAGGWGKSVTDSAGLAALAGGYEVIGDGNGPGGGLHDARIDWHNTAADASNDPGRLVRPNITRGRLGVDPYTGALRGCLTKCARYTESWALFPDIQNITGVQAFTDGAVEIGNWNDAGVAVETGATILAKVWLNPAGVRICKSATWPAKEIVTTCHVGASVYGGGPRALWLAHKQVHFAAPSDSLDDRTDVDRLAYCGGTNVATDPALRCNNWGATITMFGSGGKPYIYPGNCLVAVGADIPAQFQGRRMVILEVQACDPADPGTDPNWSSGAFDYVPGLYADFLTTAVHRDRVTIGDYDGIWQALIDAGIDVYGREWTVAARAIALEGATLYVEGPETDLATGFESSSREFPASGEYWLSINPATAGPCLAIKVRMINYPAIPSIAEDLNPIVQSAANIHDGGCAIDITPSDLPASEYYLLQVTYARSEFPLLRADGWDYGDYCWHEGNVFYRFYAGDAGSGTQCAMGAGPTALGGVYPDFLATYLMREQPFASTRLAMLNGGGNAIATAYTNAAFSGLERTRAIKHYDVLESGDERIAESNWASIPGDGDHVWCAWDEDLSSSPLTLQLGLVGHRYRTVTSGTYPNIITSTVRDTTLLDGNVGAASNSSAAHKIDVLPLAKAMADLCRAYDDFGILPFAADFAPTWATSGAATEMRDFMRKIADAALQPNITGWMQCAEPGQTIYGPASGVPGVPDGEYYYLLDGRPVALNYFPLGTVGYLEVRWDTVHLVDGAGIVATLDNAQVMIPERCRCRATTEFPPANIPSI